MNDYGLSVLEKYGLTAERVIRGRGALLCETERGPVLIREYSGSPAKLEQMRNLQKHCRESGFLMVDLVLENQEEQLVTVDESGNSYVVREWFSGKECDTRSREDITACLGTLADLHKILQMEDRESAVESGDLLEDYRRHNRELSRTRRYLSRKKKKNTFEEKMAASIGCFLEQGERIAEKLDASGYRRLREQSPFSVCHGDCNQHNFLLTRKGVAVTNFEHWHREIQICDLYQFMRKILEKHHWDIRIGKEMLTAYQKKKALSPEEKENLWLQFSYPWKYWKLANFYNNSSKVLISQKNTEKLMQTVEQYRMWTNFLDKLSFFFGLDGI